MKFVVKRVKNYQKCEVFGEEKDVYLCAENFICVMRHCEEDFSPTWQSPAVSRE